MILLFSLPIFSVHLVEDWVYERSLLFFHLISSRVLAYHESSDSHEGYHYRVLEYVFSEDCSMCEAYLPSLDASAYLLISLLDLHLILIFGALLLAFESLVSDYRISLDPEVLLELCSQYREGADMGGREPRG
jgi:hypothetical protein